MTRHLPEQTRREQILSAARQCFIERGYHPTRMEDIAATAALSKGGVYFHFDSKREVFDALVEEEYARSMELLKKVTSSEASLVEKMQVIGMHYLEYFNTAPDAPRFFIVMGEMGLRDAELAKKLLAMQTAFIGEAEKLIQQGIREGVVREVDARAVGALLKALLDGVEGLNALQYPFEVPQLLATGIDLLLHGLARRAE